MIWCWARILKRTSEKKLYQKPTSENTRVQWAHLWHLCLWFGLVHLFITYFFGVLHTNWQLSSSTTLHLLVNFFEHSRKKSLSHQVSVLQCIALLQCFCHLKAAASKGWLALGRHKKWRLSENGLNGKIRAFMLLVFQTNHEIKTFYN